MLESIKHKIEQLSHRPPQNANSKKRQREFSPARNFALIALTMLGLSVLYPAPLMATSMQQKVPTATQPQTPSPEQTQQQKGQQRVNDQLESLKTEMEQMGGQMDEETYSGYLLLIEALKNLEPETMEKFADELKIIPVKTDNFLFFTANAEIIYCQDATEDLSTKIKQGEKNARQRISILWSEHNEDGTPKTEKQKGIDGYTGAIISDHLLAEWQLNELLKLDAKMEATANVSEKKYYLSQKKMAEKYIERQLDFLAHTASKGCSVETMVNDTEFLIVINKNYCLEYHVLYDGKWNDETPLFQWLLDDTFASESLQNQQFQPLISL